MSRAQLAELGISEAAIGRWVDAGYLHRIHPRVYAVGHRAPSVEADLAAALLYAGPGAMLSHATAAWWLDLIDKKPSRIDVSTLHRRRSVRGVRVHDRRDTERIWHKRLPTTSVAQTLLDYASVAQLIRVRRALAVADYRGVLDLTELKAILGRGRAGSAKLRTALESHEPRLARTLSPLEEDFIPLCESGGIPMPEINERIEGILVDAVWRDRWLVVELDGGDNHSSWAQVQRDRSDELCLRAAGFQVIRYGWTQVTDEPDLVVADLRAQLAQRPASHNVPR